MLYILPGMGATSEMYQGCWRDLEDARFLDWPGHAGERDLPQVAQRLIEEQGISSRDSIAGSSLGGIVALEIHSMLQLHRTILIGSAVNKDEINALLRTLAPIAGVTPIRLAQLLVGKSESAIAKMFVYVEASFVAAMCKALSRWGGYHGTMEQVHRIHGAKDKVIPCPEYVETIPDGGHLVAMTHPEECVAFVKNVNISQ